MNEIMNKLFEQYNFVKTWEEDNRMFYVNTDKNIISQTVDKTLLVSTPEAFFLFWVQKVCT